jgi:hypothetical protein
MILGSVAGGYAAVLFEPDASLLTSFCGSTIGALLGIWLAFKVS